MEEILCICVFEFRAEKIIFSRCLCTKFENYFFDIDVSYVYRVRNKNKCILFLFYQFNIICNRK